MRRFLVFLFAFVSLSVGAAELNFSPITKGDFTQEHYLAKAQRSLVSTGTFVMAQEKGIIFDVQKPFPSKMIVTREKLVQVLNNSNVSVMDGADNAIFKNIAEIISSVFSGDAKALEENFLVAEEKGEKRILTLTPKDPFLALLFERFVLCVGDSIESLTVVETSGNWVGYKFSNLIFPEKLTDGEEKLFSY